LFRLGLGGRIGSGRQWWSWVTLDDYVRAVRFVQDHDELAGPVNVSAPEPLRNSDMTAAMGRVLHRPTVFAAPGFALRVPLRDFAEDLLGGQRVVPARLLAAGFEFAHPTFEPALREVLATGHRRTTS
jgi:NAD dependent epimerase/dehydratase family enzyme